MNSAGEVSGAKRASTARRFARAGMGLGLLSAALLGLGAMSEAEAGPDNGPAATEARVAFAAQQADGKKVYGTVCSSCHQQSGEGVPGMFPPLAGSEWVTGDEKRLVLIILHGVTGEIEVMGEVYSGMMPPWGGALSDAEVAAVSTYIRSTWGNKASAVTAATVAKIRAEHAARKTPWTAKELALTTATKK